MTTTKTKEKRAVSLAMAILGRQGGKSKSPKKQDAARRSIAKARESRWPSKPS